MYQADQLALPQPSKIVCVGRNYAAHAAELGNEVPAAPLLFMKPPSSITYLPKVMIPTQQGECQHEVELAVLIGQPLTAATPASAQTAIAAVGVALDLTLREVQSQLKAQGQPWERAKAFDGACVLSSWLTSAELALDQPLQFGLEVNGQPRQQGDSRLMIFPIAELLAEVSQSFSLVPGDVVLTGTPAGVAGLAVGDELQLWLQPADSSFSAWQWQGQVEAGRG